MTPGKQGNQNQSNKFQVLYSVYLCGFYHSNDPLKHNDLERKRKLAALSVSGAGPASERELPVLAMFEIEALEV